MSGGGGVISRRKALASAGVFLVTAACNPDKLFGPETKVPKKFFGHQVPGYVVQTDGSSPVDIPIGTLRTWDTGAVLAELVKGNNDGLSGQLALAQKLSAEPLYVFGAHASNPLPDALCLPGTMVPTMDAWASLIDMVIRKSAGRVRAYELWNEPAVTSEYWQGGTVEQLVERVRFAYGFIKTVQPEAVVLTPSFNEMSDYGAAFADSYFAIGGDACDGVAFHSYGDVQSDLRVLKSIMQGHGVRKPIWNTETVGIETLEYQARAGVERVVLNAQIAGHEDYDKDTPLGRVYCETFERLAA